jgi:hypothetical protein
VPKKTPANPKQLYRRSAPKAGRQRSEAGGQISDFRHPASDFPHAHPIAPAHFELREDGSIVGQASRLSPSSEAESGKSETGATPVLLFRSETPFVRLYHGNCLEMLDAIYAKYPDGRFDAIFADPPT